MGLLWADMLMVLGHTLSFKTPMVWLWTPVAAPSMSQTLVMAAFAK